MHLIENYELTAPRAVAFQLKAGSEIRVVSGRLWLTLQGQPEDVWLKAGEVWTLPVIGQVWLSAEPAAHFRIAHFAAVRRLQSLRQPEQNYFTRMIVASTA